LSRNLNDEKDPPFLAALRLKIKAGEAPVPKPEKITYKKPIRVFDREATMYSVIIHGTLVLLVMVKTFFPDWLMSRDEIQARLRMTETKSAIRVDVVGLPSLKRDQIEKLDLTQDPTKKIGDTGAQDQNEVPVAEVSKNAMKLPNAEAQQKTLQETAKKQRDERLKAAKASLKKELTAEARRKALMEKLGGGKGEGRAAVEGNIVSKGYAASGGVATQMDAYQGQLRGHIRRFWNVPSWMNASALQARILVRLSFDGRIVQKEFLAKSGNEEFDRYVEKTISDAEPFPAPPDLLKRTMLEEGVEWGFPQ